MKNKLATAALALASLVTPGAFAGPAAIDATDKTYAVGSTPPAGDPPIPMSAQPNAGWSSWTPGFRHLSYTPAPQPTPGMVIGTVMLGMGVRQEHAS